MATAALVRDVFGSDSDTDDARDAREASTEARDAIPIRPRARARRVLSELDHDDDDADDDANDARRVESTPLHIELASCARTRESRRSLGAELTGEAVDRRRPATEIREKNDRIVVAFSERVHAT